MPFNFEQGRRAIEQEPDFVGEEGILNRLETGDGQAVWIKRWYNMHGTHRRGRSYDVVPQNTLQDISIEDNRTLETAESHGLSPYWAKRIFYEYKLINTLFPDNTVQMIAAVDPRIGKDGSGAPTFDQDNGFPITITQEVVGNSEQQAEYRRILDSIYESLTELHTRYGNFFIKNDTRDPEKAAAYDATAAAVRDGEVALAELMGNPDGLELLDDMKNHRTNALSELRTKDPNHLFVQMADAGIYVVHPSFNMVLQPERSDLPEPRGTYLELTIIDPNQTHTYVHDKVTEPAAAKKAHNYLARYRVYDWLDELYIATQADVLDWCYVPPEIQRDREVTDALFELTETIRVGMQQMNVEQLSVEKAIEQLKNDLVPLKLSDDKDPVSVATAIMDIQEVYEGRLKSSGHLYV